MSNRKGRHAVLIVTTPAVWKPTHWHAVPFDIEGAHFLARRLKLPEAIRMARKFNKEHLPGPGDAFGGEWALCIKNVRFRGKMHVRVAETIALLRAVAGRQITDQKRVHQIISDGHLVIRKESRRAMRVRPVHPAWLPLMEAFAAAEEAAREGGGSIDD